MQRPLAVVTAAACFLLLFSVVANLIAIRESAPVRGGSSQLQPLEPTWAPASQADSGTRPALPFEPAGIAQRADQLAARLLHKSGLGTHGELPYTLQTRVLVESKGTGRWVTLTEVRAPCADVDRALARASDAALGRPDRCERWVETAAAVLERHGVSQTSAREFLERNQIDTSVRVLLVYAGWRADAEGTASLAAAGSAPVYPRERFPLARSEALDSIYRELRLGPYTEG